MIFQEANRDDQLQHLQTPNLRVVRFWRSKPFGACRPLFLFLLMTKVAANHAVHKKQSCAVQCKYLGLGRFGIIYEISFHARISLKYKDF